MHLCFPINTIFKSLPKLTLLNKQKNLALFNYF